MHLVLNAVVDTIPCLPGGVIDLGREGASGFWTNPQGCGGYFGPHDARSSLDLPVPGPARLCKEGRQRLHQIQALNLLSE